MLEAGKAAKSLSDFLADWDYERLEKILHRRAQEPAKLSRVERKVFKPNLLNFDWEWNGLVAARLSKDEKLKLELHLKRIVKHEQDLERQRDRQREQDL